MPTQMPTSVPTPIQSKPGIQRDGTDLDSDRHSDGQWCRWQRGRPRKMGGYRALSTRMGGISRGMRSYTTGGITYVHTGAFDRVEQLMIGDNGSISPFAARTPGSAFTADANLVWQFDAMQDAITAKMAIIAHAAPNLATPDSAVGGSVFIGDMTGAAALTPIVDANVSGVNAPSGGICVIHPYLFVFGTNGTVSWCVANHPQDFTNTGSGQAYITSQKVVAGRMARGSSGFSPSGLLWSLDALTRVSFSGGSTVWSFDRVSEINILSPSSIVEFDGVYYWVGLGRFWTYSGVAKELPNDTNLNYFFDGLNWDQRQNVYGFAVPRFGEIWWCYPRGTATECTHAVIFNAREGCWYDTQLPNGGRSAASTVATSPYPIMGGVDASSNDYVLWQHEYGADEVNGTSLLAVRSWYETSNLTMLKNQQPVSRQMEVAVVEPDFVQTGDLTMTVKGQANARAPVETSEIFTIPETAATPDDEVVSLREVRRLMSFRFESNVVGGYYEGGSTIAHVKPTDDRQTS